MTVFRNMNFAFCDPICEKGDEFIDCNLSQQLPNTFICESISGLTFRNCNLTNCTIPVDAVKDECNHRHVEFCKHIVPMFKALPDEPDECAHVVATKIIDGKSEFVRENVANIDIALKRKVISEKGDGVKPADSKVEPVADPVSDPDPINGIK
jgi:hypothetical protein